MHKPLANLAGLSHVIRQLEDESLKNNFSKFFFKSFEAINPGQRLENNWHIDCLCEYLTACYNKEIKRLIINIPFRMLKSSICSMAFPAWGLGKNPALKFMCVSYADELATDLSVKSRQLVESPWYQQLFPELKLIGSQKTRFETTQNGYRLATSTGSGAMGQGANFLIVDDYLSTKMVTSDQERTTALSNFNPVFKTRLNNQNDDVIIVIEQRLHDKDLSGMLLNEGGYEHLCLQGKFDKKRIISFGNFTKEVEENELLQPQRLSQKVLDELKVSLGSQIYSAQIQQNPVVEGGNMIKMNWWRRFELEVAALMQYETTVVSVDSAYKAGELNDPSSFGCFKIKDNNADLIDVVNERMEYPELKRRLITFLEHHNPDYVLIEDKASGQSLIQDLKRETRFAVIAIKPEGDKIVRLSNGSALVEAGRIGLPIKANWLYDFETQVSKFPKGDHDDMVDMLSGFLNWFKNRTANFEFFSINI